MIDILQTVDRFKDSPVFFVQTNTFLKALRRCVFCSLRDDEYDGLGGDTKMAELVFSGDEISVTCTSGQRISLDIVNSLRTENSSGKLAVAVKAKKLEIIARTITNKELVLRPVPEVGLAIMDGDSEISVLADHKFSSTVSKIGGFRAFVLDNAHLYESGYSLSTVWARDLLNAIKPFAYNEAVGRNTIWIQSVSGGIKVSQNGNQTENTVPESLRGGSGIKEPVLLVHSYLKQLLWHYGSDFISLGWTGQMDNAVYFGGESSFRHLMMPLPPDNYVEIEP